MKYNSKDLLSVPKAAPGGLGVTPHGRISGLDLMAIICQWRVIQKIRTQTVKATQPWKCHARRRRLRKLLALLSEPSGDHVQPGTNAFGHVLIEVGTRLGAHREGSIQRGSS